jgi:hypothetical protein
MYTFNNQESQKKSVGYTKTKLGLDTKFERGISANTFSALEGRPKSHLAARLPSASCLYSRFLPQLVHHACPAPTHPAWLVLVRLLAQLPSLARLGFA